MSISVADALKNFPQAGVGIAISVVAGLIVRRSGQTPSSSPTTSPDQADQVQPQRFTPGTNHTPASTVSSYAARSPSAGVPEREQAHELPQALRLPDKARDSEGPGVLGEERADPLAHGARSRRMTSSALPAQASRGKCGAVACQYRHGPVETMEKITRERAAVDEMVHSSAIASTKSRTERNR